MIMTTTNLSNTPASIAQLVLRRLSRAGCIALLVLGITACAPNRPAIDTANWLVLPERSGPARKTQSELWLKIGAFSVAPPFDGKSLVYRVADQRYEKDFYNAYITLPSDMVSNASRQWLNQSGIFRIVVGQSTSFFPFYTLQASVDELYGDYRGQPEAVVSIQFFLTVTNAGTNNPLITTKRFTKRVALPNTTPQALVQGQQQALAEILQQFEADLVATSGALPKPMGR